MSIAFDTATGSSNSGSLTLTFSHTCTGSNRLLCVGVWDEDGDTVTSVKYNNVSMTQAGKALLNGGSLGYSYLYYLAGPTTGANNVSITRSTSSGRLRGDSSSYTGVSSLSTLDTSNTGSSGSSPLTIAVTTVSNNCWTVMVAANGQPVSASTGTTARNGFSGSAGILSGIGDSNGPKTPAGSVSMSVTTGGTVNFGGVVGSFTPFSGTANVSSVSDIQASTDTHLTKAISAHRSESVSGSDTVSMVTDKWKTESKNNGSWTAETKSL